MGLFDIAVRALGYPRPVGYETKKGVSKEFSPLDHEHQILPATWTKLALLNGWTHSNTPQEDSLRAMVDPMGFVHIEGSIIPGTLALGTQLVTLPIRFRPRIYNIPKAFVLRVTAGTTGIGCVIVDAVAGTINISPTGPVWTGATVVSFNLIYEVNRDLPDVAPV